MNKFKWLSYENGLMVILGLTFGLVAFDRNAVSVLTPFIIEELSLSNSQLGMLSSGLALAWALSAYLIGGWSDRNGSRKPFLLIAIVVFSLCSVLSGFAGSFIFLLVARVVMGVAEGPFLPISLSIMNAESSPNRRGLNAGIIQSVFASLIATTLAPIVLVYLAQLYDWRVTFFLTGIPGLICGVLVWKFVREPRISEDVEDEAVKEEVVQNEVIKGNPLSVAFRMFKYRNILVCSLVSCLMVAWFLTGMTFLPVFFTSFKNYSPEQMSGLMAAIGLSTVFCGFLVPALSDRIGRKPVVMFFCFASILTPLAALYFDGPLWLLSVLLFLGWSGTGIFPIFMAVIPGETVSPKLTATAMGLVVCTGEVIGGFFGPIIGGWMADSSTLAAPILATAVCAFCAGVISLFLVETAPKNNPL